MILERQQVLDRLNENQKSGPLQAAVKHENRLRLHAEPVLHISDAGPAFKNFLSWAAAFLSKDKYEKFLQLIPQPLPTVELTDTIFKELYRIFEAQNSYFSFEFTQPELAADFDNYLADNLEDNNFWRREGFQAMKTGINSLVVVDLPRDQVGPLPEPYYHLVDISRVRSVLHKRDGYTEYAIFENGPDELIAIDEKFYRVITKDGSGVFNNFAVEKEHGLGYTPVKAFWNDFLTTKDTVQRKSPITNSLGQLDKVIFWEVSIEYYNTYGVFPIYWAYKSKCQFKDDQGNECTKGVIKYQYLGEPKQKPCPACEGNKMIGAGSVIRVPAPVDKQDSDLRDPVGKLDVDVEALRFAETFLQNKKDNVYLNCVGRNGEPNNDQAQNEKQVSAAFESKQNVLLAVKRNFEVVHKWTLETVARLRYSERFLTATVNYGDRFYLKSEAELTQEYEAGKKAGLPMYELAETREQIQETKYRNNLGMQERCRILGNLEPYPELSITEISALLKDVPGAVNIEDFILKLNFDNIVKEFEREYGPLTQYLTANDFETRIFIIKKQFYDYAKARQQSQPA